MGHRSELKRTVADLKAKIEARKEEIREILIPVANVHPQRSQPRQYFNKKKLQDLARSIVQVGQQVAITVKLDPEEPGTYIVIDGERRLRACKMMGRQNIRATIRPAESEDQSFIRSVVANFGREGHTPHEIALAVRRIQDMGKSIQEIAGMFAKSDTWVYQHLSLTKLDRRVAAMMNNNIPFERRLKFAIAILLTSLPAELQFEIASYITTHQMRLTAARHFVEVRAQQAGHKVGGIASRPEKRRGSLTSLLELVASSLPSFLEMPDTPAHVFLDKFPPDELANLAKLIDAFYKGAEALKQAMAQVLNSRGTSLQQEASAEIVEDEQPSAAPAAVPASGRIVIVQRSSAQVPRAGQKGRAAAVAD